MNSTCSVRIAWLFPGNIFFNGIFSKNKVRVSQHSVSLATVQWMPGISPHTYMWQSKVYSSIAKCHLWAKSPLAENHWIKVREELTCVEFHLQSKVYICYGINSSSICKHMWSSLQIYQTILVILDAWVSCELFLLSALQYYKIKHLCSWWESSRLTLKS